jgi:hypothetical protein
MGHLYHGELLNNQRVAWFKHQSWNFTKQNWGWKCCWIRNSREFISVKRMIPWENWWFNRPGNYPNLCGLSLKGNSCRKKKNVSWENHGSVLFFFRKSSQWNVGCGSWMGEGDWHDTGKKTVFHFDLMGNSLFIVWFYNVSLMGRQAIASISSMQWWEGPPFKGCGRFPFSYTRPSTRSDARYCILNWTNPGSCFSFTSWYFDLIPINQPFSNFHSFWFVILCCVGLVISALPSWS